MARRLRMTAELGDWLTELGEAQAATATEVGAALLAVLTCADPTALPAVGESTPDPRELADSAYQQVLENLQRIRHQLAYAATDRKRTGLLLDARRRAGSDAGQTGALERRLAVAQQHEARLTQRAQRLQSQADAFRSAKESAKAMYTAAEAQLRIAEALDAVGGAAHADFARLREELRVAEDKLRALKVPPALSAVGRQRADQADENPPSAAAERPKPPPQPQPAAEPAPGLLELRADPLGSDIRILFAVEPAGTVTLLAVLEGPEAVTVHSAEAIRLASDLLTEIRADGWPADIEEVVLADPEAFLARFFPANDGSISRRAAALADTQSIRKRREDLRLSIAEVAARSGLDADRVAAIERGGLRTARVHEAVALARALGARLELPADSGPVLT